MKQSKTPEEIVLGRDPAADWRERPSAHGPPELPNSEGAFPVATGWLPLVRAQREYIELLTAELSEASPLLAIHGWTSKRVEAGRLAREKIAITEAAANIGDVGCAGEARPPHTQP